MPGPHQHCVAARTSLCLLIGAKDLLLAAGQSVCSTQSSRLGHLGKMLISGPEVRDDRGATCGPPMEAHFGFDITRGRPCFQPLGSALELALEPSSDPDQPPMGGPGGMLV